MKISPQVSLTLRQIMLMNFGFFGIQYSFGLQQTAINPIFSFLQADPAKLPYLNMAGPITGLLVQPLIGAVHGFPGSVAAVRISCSAPSVAACVCSSIRTLPHCGLPYCCCGSWTSATTPPWNLSVPLSLIPSPNANNLPAS